MTNFDLTVFRNATVTDFDNGWAMIDYPAFSYITPTTDETIINVDKGGEHLGQRKPGVAVAFPTRNHGMLHKHFGIGTDDENGKVFTYGKATSITAAKREKQALAAVPLGGLVRYEGKVYRVRETANQNIALDLVE